MSHDSGLFALTTHKDLKRFYWEPNTSSMNEEVIPHWGADLVPGSMIRGGFGEKIYGVNYAGQIFSTWRNGGAINFTLIDPPGDVSVHPDSLVMSHGSGLFAVSTNGALERFYWSNGWQRQVLHHSGADLVPGSLIRAGGEEEFIFGVNTAGQIFTTRSDTDPMSSRLIDPPVRVSVHPDSLVMTGLGLFAVSINGALERFYRDSSHLWQRQTIPHWGADLEPGSMIRGGNGEGVYGVNTADQIFTTSIDNSGVISFELIDLPGNPILATVYPDSLVMSHDSGLFAVGTNGNTFLRFYRDSSGLWQRQRIPYWGALLRPGSMIRGGFGEKIYGVNYAGQIFSTWKDNGVITFALIP